jgi:hypothetical protein
MGTRKLRAPKTAAQAEAERQALLAELYEQAARCAGGESDAQLTEACGDPLLGTAEPA